MGEFKKCRNGDKTGKNNFYLVLLLVNYNYKNTKLTTDIGMYLFVFNYML